MARKLGCAFAVVDSCLGLIGWTPPYAIDDPGLIGWTPPGIGDPALVERARELVASAIDGGQDGTVTNG